MGNWVGKCDQSDPEKPEVSNVKLANNTAVANIKPANNTATSGSETEPASEPAKVPTEESQVGGSKRKSKKSSRKTRKDDKTRKSKDSRKH